MSRIDELIAELAPQGVEVRALGDVGEFVRGSGLQKVDLVAVGAPAIHYGQVHTHYGVWARSTKSYTDPELASRLRRARPGDLIIATTSEDDRFVAKATAWVGEGEVAVSGDAYIYRHSLDPRYISYFFQSEHFQRQKMRYITGTKVRRISGDSLAKIRLPEPPLAVQREVVRILDHFAQLEAELEAELEARRRQYEHYRRRIIADSVASPVRIGDLGRWYGGVTPSKADQRYWESGEIPWLASMDVGESGGNEIRGRVTSIAIEETSLQIVPSPSVAVVMRSNILRRRLPIGLVRMDTTVNQDVRALVAREGVDAEFVYQALRAASEDIRSTCVRTDGSMAAVVSTSFFSYEIPLPPPDDQKRIAAELRAFDTLVNDLSIGLPAELAARRKQYEHYRDRLLTFPEKVA